ncbi:hypothetical protein [Paenibacillus segetis]|uniref:Negative regulatory protein YxlD n=1 Tax=Paenibacillus segetis TaxID=1325360 RepID=A0ABQ1YW40_9BACL|nr:hypothetical protein [Paenibacillus segetis]GGH38844.1 negative regulatory protein YxlD [Paenibacillus segetis]
MNSENPPLWLWIAVGILLFSQGTWMFINASKRGKRAWLWGLWGILNCPAPLIVYWLVVVWPERRKKTKI